MNKKLSQTIITFGDLDAAVLCVLWGVDEVVELVILLQRQGAVCGVVEDAEVSWHERLDQLGRVSLLALHNVDETWKNCLVKSKEKILNFKSSAS